MKLTDAIKFLQTVSSERELQSNVEFNDLMRGYRIDKDKREFYHAPPKATAQQVVDFLTAALECPYIHPRELTKYIRTASTLSLTSNLTFTKVAPLMELCAQHCRNENYHKDNAYSPADKRLHKEKVKYLHYSFLKFMDLFLTRGEPTADKEVQQFCLEHDLTDAFGTLPNLPSEERAKKDVKKYHSKLLRQAVNFFGQHGVLALGDYSRLTDLTRYRYDEPQKRRVYDEDDDDFEKPKPPTPEVVTKRPFSEHYPPRRIAGVIMAVREVMLSYKTTIGNVRQRLGELGNKVGIDLEFTKNFKSGQPENAEFFDSCDTAEFNHSLNFNFSKGKLEDVQANNMQVAKALDYLAKQGIKISFRDKELQDCAAELQKKYSKVGSDVKKAKVQKIIPRSRDYTI